MFFKKKIIKGEKNLQKINQAASKEDGILVLGTGCAKCKKLEENIKKSLVEMGIEEEVKHIKDFKKIASYGVMSTPALVIDKKVVSIGKVLPVKDLKEILREKR